MSFLTVAGRMAWDADLAPANWTELRRVADTLVRAEATGHGVLLADYHAHLETGKREAGTAHRCASTLARRSRSWSTPRGSIRT